jgi:hypothetical protein
MPPTPLDSNWHSLDQYFVEFEVGKRQRCGITHKIRRAALARDPSLEMPTRRTPTYTQVQWTGGDAIVLQAQIQPLLVPKFVMFEKFCPRNISGLQHRVVAENCK